MTAHNFSKIEKAFYSDGFIIGMQVADSKLDPEVFSSAVAEMYRNIDRLTHSLTELSVSKNSRIFCRKGCAFCCHQPVFALTHEIRFLAGYIKSNFDEETIGQIRNSAISKMEELKSQSHEKVMNSKIACPLLKDNACMAYEARPMACRIYLSFSPDSCEDFYQNPEEKNNFPQLLEFPLNAGRLMNEGFKAALKQAGWVSKELRIDEGLAAAFSPEEDRGSR